MKSKRKRWSEMTTEQLAKATKKFDNPNYNPPPQKPSKAQSAELRRVQRKVAQNRSRIAVALEENLIEQADEYAADHGITFSELVSNALRQLMRKKSA